MTKKHLVIGFIFYFLVSTAITSVWFNKGTVLAGAEEGLLFYNINRSLELFKSAWVETGLGIGVALLLPKVTMLYSATILQGLGLQQFQVQQIMFILLIFCSLFSFNLLVNKLFPEINRYISLFGSLFYLFNLYSMTQIWFRFLTPLFFLWAYLPIFLLTYLNLFNKSSFKNWAIFLLSSLLFSTAFSIPSGVIVIWLIALPFMFFTKSKSNFYSKLFKFLLIFLAWVLVNIWWIYPTYTLKGNTYLDSLGTNQSIESLKQVSEFYPNLEILTLRQKYMLGEGSPWRVFYDLKFSQSASILILVIVILGIISTKRDKRWLALVFILIVGWFLAKGTNPPLGLLFYETIFNKVPYLQILRNPYEKVGLIFLLSYTLFFILGINYIFTKKIKYLSGLAVIFVLYISIWYLPWPIRTDRFFIANEVKVPNEYGILQHYFLDKEKRVLQLPFFTGANVKYGWGYFGEEPSEYLFPLASLYKTYSIPEIDNFYLSIFPFVENKNFINILSILNIDYVVTHKDIVINSLHKPDDNNFINNNASNYKQLLSNDYFSIYQVVGSKDLGMIYAVSNLNRSSNIDKALSIITSDKYDISKEATYVCCQKDIDILKSAVAPSLEYKKLSSRLYKVKVSKAKEPYILILSNNYNKNWIAKSNEVVIGKHFKVNGYANGWIIDKQGDYEIDIIFPVWPWE